MALLSCSETGSAPSSSPGEAGPLIGADATLGDSPGLDLNPATSVALPEASWSTGPDGAAPATCDAASACVAPPPSCSGPSSGVLYGAQQCTSGVCSWMTTAFDCAAHGSPGALCIGGWNGDASLPPDAGMGARNGPCWLPAPQGPAPPVVACDVDAGDGGALCPPPPSQCVDGVDGGTAGPWLAYYDNGKCVSGQCAWETKLHFCGYSACVSGACIRSITAPAGP